MSAVQSRGPQVPEQEQDVIEHLASRLDRAERQLKSVRAVIVALAVLAVAPLLAQLGKPSVLKADLVVAENFGVRNAKGDLVARLGTSDDGSPSIALADADRKIRLVAALDATGRPALSLLDPQANSRAVLSLNAQNDPSLAMLGPGNVLRGVFSIDSGGAGHLNLNGAAGGLDLAAHDGRLRWKARDSAPVDEAPTTK